MKKLGCVLVLAAAFCTFGSGKTNAWSPATHAHIADEIGKPFGLRNLNEIYGAMAPDVSVNCVAPGLMEATQMAQRLPEQAVTALRERSLLKNNTSIQDVADQIVQFCRADSITGQTLVIDGGIYFH